MGHQLFDRALAALTIAYASACRCGALVTRLAETPGTKPPNQPLAPMKTTALQHSIAASYLRRACAVGLLAAAGCLTAPRASAQYVMEFAQTYNAPASNFISNTFLNQEAMINATRPGAAQGAKPQPPLAAPQVERNAAELASAAPAAQRARLEKVYAQLMPGYHQLERKLGWPADDVAGAMAAVVAGNYMAMTGTELSDASVSAAGNQLRASAAVQNLLTQLSPTDRRRLYEQCAMLGTFMALANKTSQQQPANVVANLRQSARENLRVFLGDAADTVRFTPQGLQLR